MERRGDTLVDALVVAVVPWADEEDEEMALWCITTTAKRHVIQSISAPSEGKPSRGAHVSTTLPDNEQLRTSLSNSRCSNSNRTHKLSLSLSLPLSLKHVLLSFVLLRLCFILRL